MRAYLAGIKTREPQVQLALVLNEPGPKEVTHVWEESPASGLKGLKVGDILQCVNRVTLDSDAPGPAMVEVVSGPYRGARVVVSFQRLNEHLVLRFSELAAPDGSVHDIAGFAIDPATDRTAVRTDVDNHVLERWGGLVAASFLEGFGEAVERSGTSAHTTIYGSGWSVPDYSLGEEMWIAAGKAGERAANALDRGFELLGARGVEAAEHLRALEAPPALREAPLELCLLLFQQRYLIGLAGRCVAVLQPERHIRARDAAAEPRMLHSRAEARRYPARRRFVKSLFARRLAENLHRAANAREKSL